MQSQWNTAANICWKQLNGLREAAVTETDHNAENSLSWPLELTTELEEFHTQHIDALNASKSLLDV